MFVAVFQDIANAWKGLENAEKGFEDWLLSELQRLNHFLFYIFSFWICNLLTPVLVILTIAMGKK